MKKSIGLLEFKSIAKGIEATDHMLKSANVELVLSSPLCPGKYITILCGDVGAVKNAVKTGEHIGGNFIIDSYVIANVHEDIFPALTATTNIERISSLGIIETMSAITSIMAGDIALKAANVQLLEIRVARGLGGKGFILLTGEIGAVKSAVKTCEHKLEETGDIISTVVIASPSADLIPKLL
ncbi:BMC domain-containing protein [Marinisporobacter balticus]|uniref:Microcompartment protein CcmL/EutN n=1 Tax=Marinisporobacter balticus TaxID=2018667 RepID=A0A4R2KU68_9FIRM|nr:BMC domain-containing protein [Marinisporobacter balticus]TCO77951.1 microcompartment protein CcmL/EutN [Marinisporobacter balticus]